MKKLPSFSSDIHLHKLPSLRSLPLRKPNQTTSLANTTDSLWELEGSLAPHYLLFLQARLLLVSLVSLQHLCSRRSSLGLHSFVLYEHHSPALCEPRWGRLHTGTSSVHEGTASGPGQDKVELPGELVTEKHSKTSERKCHVTM